MTILTLKKTFCNACIYVNFDLFVDSFLRVLMYVRLNMSYFVIAVSLSEAKLCSGDFKVMNAAKYWLSYLHDVI